MLLFLYATVACVSDSPVASRAAIVAPVLTYSAEPAADTLGYEDAPPAGCSAGVYAAQAGNLTDVPVLADAHAEVYGSAPTPALVHLGLPGDPSTSMAIVWKTDGGTLATQVQLGLDATYGTTLDGGSFLLLGSDSADQRIHEVHICDLAPNTTWHYRVGGAGAWSPDYTFTTAPVPGSTGPVVFGVAGDSRGAPTTWGAVAAGQASHGAELRLFTGDAVSTGYNIASWDDWFEAAAGSIESVPTLMAHGNHEGNAQPFFAFSAAPGNEKWYSFDYGNVHIVALNDTVSVSTDWSVQAEWLAADLAATSQPWKIVFHHKPGYSSCAPNGTDANVRTWFVPVEEAGGVQLDFAGHNHNYERTVPLRGGVEVAAGGGGVTYVVTAGAGAPLYDNNQGYFYTAVAQETQHYVMVAVNGDTLTVTAYDLADNVLDTFTLTQ